MNKIIIFGAAGFIGTNLVIKLLEDKENQLTLVDKKKKYFPNMIQETKHNISIQESDFNASTDFVKMVDNHDIVYHLVSTTVPTTSNQAIADELQANVVVTSKLLDACVHCGVKKVIFISSGGTVYGNEGICPLKEDSPTNPISSYGIQKITIEKLLYLYNYMHSLDYRVVRLANPYGPHQRPNGVLGAVTTFVYKALTNQEITVYGDGSVIRDFIYIDDAIRGILNIANSKDECKVYNLGSGYGTSIKQVLEIIQSALDIELNIKYLDGRKVDVPVNFLDMSRYEKYFGQLNPISLYDGIIKTADFLKNINLCNDTM